MNTLLLRLLAGSLLLGGVALGALLLTAASSDTEPAPPGMVYVAEGTYQPLFKNPEESEPYTVKPFFLQETAVTRADFLAFVEDNPRWRKSNIATIFADEQYLKDWPSDLDFGPEELANTPVTNVSWHAARAYADWRGMRLPTTAEWERAAMASATDADGLGDPDFLRRLSEWYSQPAPPSWPDVRSTAQNYWGAWDMHGLVWEWVEDFNTALVRGDSRSDGDMDRVLYCGSGSIGASDFQDYAAFLRYGLRSGLQADYTVSSLGFRLAMDVPTSSPDDL